MICILVAVVCALAAVSTNVLAGKNGENRDAARKKGAVSCVDVSGVLNFATNETGRVTGLVITGATGTAYIVVMEGFTQDIGKLIGKQVTAKGEVKEIDGKLTLKVRGGIRAGGEKSGGRGRIVGAGAAAQGGQ